ncbi:hypothetical protein [Lacinutrix himadriensis]|uniref:hypothetical protein n=1 Tax=Lacinutrix himadriensis TaxID=641549 RepID=UPI0006E3A9F2|nr:hypothetical protein [Lacinutrix himadriensis]
MKNIKTLLLFASVLLIASCSSDDDNTPSTPMSTLTVNLFGIAPLEGDVIYEGWVMVDGSPVSTGRFNTTSANNITKTFRVPTAELDVATAFILSIEPKTNDDPAPSNTKIMSGDFIGNSNAATLNIENQFSGILGITGKFILATPTDAVADNDEFGVWFMNPPNAGLTNLPTLASGWKYEGWVDINGTAISTGKFTNANSSDESSFFSGNETAPSFPGEDFLATGVPIDGITFPIDLRNQKVVVSIEPHPDNSASPFYLKPLTANTNTAIGGSNVYSMTLNNASFPSGLAVK